MFDKDRIREKQRTAAPQLLDEVLDLAYCLLRPAAQLVLPSQVRQLTPVQQIRMDQSRAPSADRYMDGVSRANADSTSTSPWGDGTEQYPANDAAVFYNGDFMITTLILTGTATRIA